MLEEGSGAWYMTTTLRNPSGIVLANYSGLFVTMIPAARALRIWVEGLGFGSFRLKSQVSCFIPLMRIIGLRCIVKPRP